MIRLKLRNPFCGSDLPVYLAAVLTIAAIAVTARLDLSEAFIPLIIAVPVITLVICFFAYQRLTPKEKEIVSRTDPPRWIPLPPELAAILAKEKGSFQPNISTIIIISAVAGTAVYGFAALGTDLRYGHLPLILAAAGIMLAVLICVLIARANNRRWAKIGESEQAQCILVPIYSKRYETSGSIAIRIEITFYLPDGRYVLPCKGTRDGDTAAIVKYRGAMTWLIVPRTIRRNENEPRNDSRAVCQKDQTVQ